LDDGRNRDRGVEQALRQGAGDRGRDLSVGAIRYISVFKYYGNAIEDGIDLLAFAGVTLGAVALAALGA